jgi:methyl-accepting chemotaxis protein
MKVLLIILMFMAVDCQAGLIGSLFTKSDVKTSNAIENQTKKIGVIEGLIDEVKASVGDLSANIQGQAGVGNKMVKTTKEMRDELNNITASLNITKNSIKEINKSITKTSIKQNQASIFYVLAIILGIICMCQMIFSFIIVSKFARASAQSIDKQMLVDKYEKELDSLREKGTIK